MRLDNILFRLGMAPTIPGARQLVNHRHILDLKKEYLLFEPYPDIRRPTRAILEIAIHKKTPILRSARTRR
ncbi:putative RNA-binding S4 domain-containing protein [Helianthus annuus]|nr:putative RNA-binding S4 domain-containing protein [Helianthus annuus]